MTVGKATNDVVADDVCSAVNGQQERQLRFRKARQFRCDRRQITIDRERCANHQCACGIGCPEPWLTHFIKFGAQIYLVLVRFRLNFERNNKGAEEDDNNNRPEACPPTKTVGDHGCQRNAQNRAEHQSRKDQRGSAATQFRRNQLCGDCEHQTETCCRSHAGQNTCDKHHVEIAGRGSNALCGRIENKQEEQATLVLNLQGQKQHSYQRPTNHHSQRVKRDEVANIRNGTPESLLKCGHHS